MLHSHTHSLTQPGRHLVNNRVLNVIISPAVICQQIGPPQLVLLADNQSVFPHHLQLSTMRYNAFVIRNSTLK